jgi:lipoprotein-anchoring transpeptidase ErfK/SrfK
VLMLVASACSSPVERAHADGQDKREQAAPAAKIEVNLPDEDQLVGLGKKVKISVTDGTVDSVALTKGARNSRLAGDTDSEKTTWTSRSRLLPDTSYALSVKAVNEQGKETVYDSTFKTQPLSKDLQTYPNFTPLSGSTVGVAMPVIIRFDIPVKRKRAFENNITVKSTPAQEGGFKWISDSELHWRPAKFWKAGTKVKVKARVGGLAAGNGIYGQMDRTLNFNVGRRLVTRVNIQTHQMQVIKDGVLLKTMPITTGRQPEHTTRSGVKVIMEKNRTRTMNSETVGIDPNSSDGYNIADVEYAQRVTSSGEFIHAAPWSVGSQGRANVSHGCTGMSTTNAGWLYSQTIIGDPVIYVGSSRPMTLTNGWGDWNETFAQYSGRTS